MVVGFLNGLAGGKDSTIRRVVPIGERELEIPADTPHNVFAVTRATMKGLGYAPWYRNCIVGQTERQLTPSEAKELTQTPQGALSVVLKAEPHCEDPGRDILISGVSSEQLSFLREQTAKSLKLLLAQEGFSANKRECIAHQIRYAPDAQTLQLADGSVSVQEALMVAFLKRCS